MHIFIRLAIGAGFVWFLWAVLQPVLALMGIQVKIDDLGQWGNSFGALNALIASIGFSAVAYTAYLQRRTLASQQEQIENNQRDQHKQRFESQYINLLQLLREVRSDVRFSFSKDYEATASSYQIKEEYIGIEAFESAFIEVQHQIGDNRSRQMIAHMYNEYVHKRYEANLGPYFRIVYTMLHMLRSDTKLDREDKIRLANLLRSQLTSPELILHGMNGLSAVSKDFGSLITEFRVLKYMPEGNARDLMLGCYAPETFQARD